MMFNKKDYVELCNKYNSSVYSKTNILTGEMKGYLIYFYIPSKNFFENYDKHRSIVLNIKTGKCIRFGINHMLLNGREFNFSNNCREISIIKKEITPVQKDYIDFFSYPETYTSNKEFNEKEGIEAYFKQFFSCFYHPSDIDYTELKILVSDLRRAKVPLKGLINYSNIRYNYNREKMTPNTNNIKKFFDIPVKELRIIGGTKGTKYEYDRTKNLQRVLNMPFKDMWELRRANMLINEDHASYYRKVTKELLKDINNSYENYYLYYDYDRMLDTLRKTGADYKEFPEVPSLENIRKKHDKLVPIYNKIKNATPKEMNDRYKEKFYKESKKFEYEDDTYSIIACKDLDELVTEGSILHHCVGSYRNSVSLGQDKILFLRKKDDLETPYFTINLSPINKVRQIHGKFNSSVTEELVPFIDAWAKKFKIDATNYGGIYCALV